VQVGPVCAVPSETSETITGTSNTFLPAIKSPPRKMARKLSLSCCGSQGSSWKRCLIRFEQCEYNIPQSDVSGTSKMIISGASNQSLAAALRTGFLELV
jgi:hypothetical protein